MNTVTIVGVGLIGASFGLALRRAGFRGRILGVSSPSALADALALGVIDEARPLEDAARDSDLVYLSQTISGILATLERLDAHLRPGALVTDAGSTKAVIVDQARRHVRRGLFLGGHPMAGKEGRGARAAEASLFDGRPYVLTPLEPADLEHEAVGEFQGWLRRIGARAVVLEPGLHDRLVALVSHLPQLASTALAASLADRPEKSALRDVVGPGVLDMTRLALSPYQIWSDIIATNQASIVAALDSYIERLLLLRNGLGSPVTAAMFEEAASLAAGLRRPATARPNESGPSCEDPP